jgi:hypothetical protein
MPRNLEDREKGESKPVPLKQSGIWPLNKHLARSRIILVVVQLPAGVPISRSCETERGILYINKTVGT